ncbi:MAG TPA: class I SAM-dependent methyltransferase [Acetobacteraceae bacterium]|nr:class I SAM-dependent methyltransferase [Acetobacteraceae bacterium]
MNDDAVKQARAEVIDRYGAWTDHNVQLTPTLYTINQARRSPKLQRIVQVVHDLARKPIADLRVLDLACLEGQYAIEFARQGAQAVGIEGREANIEKARLSKRVLGLDNLELIQGDIRDLSRERNGSFDVVLCLGVLYHLNAPDVFAFVESIAEVCTGIAVFDTYVSLGPKRSYDYKGKQYWGRDIREHPETLDSSGKLAKLWSSLDNVHSTWITKRTLVKLLLRFGFTSVYECYVPLEIGKPRDRVTIVAIKGAKAKPLTNPVRFEDCGSEWPETLNPQASWRQRKLVALNKKIVTAFPASWRRRTKNFLKSTGLRKARHWEPDAFFKPPEDS